MVRRGYQRFKNDWPKRTFTDIKEIDGESSWTVKLMKKNSILSLLFYDFGSVQY